jgi:RNA polymerase sigma-70 factor (ECF subfamily)
MNRRASGSDEKVIYYLTQDEKLNWLMEHYGTDVIRIAYTYLKHKQLAEDVAQDVFLKCYQNLDTFRMQSSYKTWIIRITVNRCKDVLKSWCYKNLILTECFPISKLLSFQKNVHHLDDDDEFISKNIMELPIKVREVIILYYYEECKIEEIANLLQINSNTVKTRLHRGRLKLKKELVGGLTISE